MQGFGEGEVEVDRPGAAPGPIPPGTYTIEATFEGESPGPAGTIELAAGQRVTLSCRSSLKRCIAC